MRAAGNRAAIGALSDVTGILGGSRGTVVMGQGAARPLHDAVPAPLGRTDRRRGQNVSNLDAPACKIGSTPGLWLYMP